MDSESTMRVVCPRTLAKLVEPYHTCSLEDGLASAGLFPSRSVKNFQKLIECLRPRLKAYAERDMEASYENPWMPFSEDYFAVNGDGLLSVCIRVNDDGKDRHKLVIYDHSTKKVKKLGYIPRHNFVQEVDDFPPCVGDPAFVEGVIGSLSDDGNFFVVLAHSEGLRVLNVFDIPSTTCLFEKDCSQIEFLKCGPAGIALDPIGPRHGRFRIAIVNPELEVRLWDAITLEETAVKLHNVNPSCALSRYLINPKENEIKFSPDCRLLSVYGYFHAEGYSACILMDPSSLEPFCMIPYNYMCVHLSCIFPCFTTCGSKLAMFTCFRESELLNLDEYKLRFFEIPLRMESLKQLCKFCILNVVDVSVLSELPLPNDLIRYLSGNMSGIPIDSSSSENNTADKKKQCNVM